MAGRGAILRLNITQKGPYHVLRNIEIIAKLRYRPFEVQVHEKYTQQVPVRLPVIAAQAK